MRRPFSCSQKCRVSDWVTGLCAPLLLLLLLHLSLLQAQIQEFQASPSVGGTVETREEVLQEDSLLLPERVKSVSLPLNVSSTANQNVLLFTPIKGSASTSFKNLLSFLRKDNQFQLYSEPLRRAQTIYLHSGDLMQRVVANVSSFKKPSVFIHSFAYIDFSQFGAQQPLQVALVRDPVERAVSLFYRARSPYQLVENFRQFPEVALPDRRFLKKSIEMCLESPYDRECQYVTGRRFPGNTLQYFCGHLPQCLNFGSEEALAIAIRNVKKSYAVVGLVEHMPVTLAVLESYLPRYFTGATQKFNQKVAGQQAMINENFYKPKVDKWALDKISRNFTVEQKFYSFLKKRLYDQYQALF